MAQWTNATEVVINEIDGITKSLKMEQRHDGVWAWCVYQDGVFYSEDAVLEPFATPAEAVAWARAADWFRI